MQNDWVIFHRNIGEVRAVGFQTKKAINTHVRKHFLEAEERWEQAVPDNARSPDEFRQQLETTEPHEYGAVLRTAHELYFETIQDGCADDNILDAARGKYPGKSYGDGHSIWVASQLGLFAAFDIETSHSVLRTAYRPLPSVTTGPKTKLRSYVHRARNKVRRLAGKRFGRM